MHSIIMKENVWSTIPWLTGSPQLHNPELLGGEGTTQLKWSRTRQRSLGTESCCVLTGSSCSWDVKLPPVKSLVRICSDLKAQGFSGRDALQHTSFAPPLHPAYFAQTTVPSAPNLPSQGQLGEAVPQSQAAARGNFDHFVFCFSSFLLSTQKSHLIDSKGFISFLWPGTSSI